MALGFELIGTNSAATFCLQTEAQAVNNAGNCHWIAHCESYTQDYSRCNTCENTYYLSGDHNTCDAVTHCQTYTSGVCQSCTNAYVLSTNNMACSAPSSALASANSHSHYTSNIPHFLLLYLIFLP